MRVYLTLMFALVFSLFSLKAEAHFDRSHVMLTNHSPYVLIVNPTLSTTDTQFTQGSQWDKDTTVLMPYETKPVLWFVRNIGVKLNQTYLFSVEVKSSLNPTLTFTFDMKAHSSYGSTLNAAWEEVAPNASLKSWLNSEGVDEATAASWSPATTLYAKTWRPSLQLFNDYQIVIDEAKPTAGFVESPNELSVLTYNTQMMPLIAGAVDRLNQPGLRAKLLPDTIRQFDVVIMQELFDEDFRALIIKGMSQTYPYHTTVVGQHSSKLLTGGVMIFSRWPITVEKDWVYIAGSGLDDLAAKGVGYAVINKSGRLYHVFGTHLESGDGEALAQVRTQQLKEMADFIRAQNISSTEPVIIGGDFNINGESPEVNNLHDLLQVSPLAARGYAYSLDPLTNTMTTEKNPQRIDFVFAQRGHRLPSSAYDEVFINRAFKTSEMWPRFDLSDHYPVAAYFYYSKDD